MAQQDKSFNLRSCGMERLLGSPTIFKAVDLSFKLTNASLERGIKGGKVLLMLGGLGSKALLQSILAQTG